MKELENILEFTLAILAILITLIMPVPINESYRQATIAAIIIFYVVLTIFRFNRRLNEQIEEQTRLEEKLKIHEQLIEIRASILDLQRGPKKWKEKTI